MGRFEVSRSIHIQAPPDRVFQTVADYRTWSTWSPWLCAEPTANVQVTEDPSSVGSVYSWSGELVGAGEIEHKHLEPAKTIRDELRFTKPFRTSSDVQFDVRSEGDGTKLTWHMRGSLPWFLFWMRPQMEGFIGMDYERGLKMLKEWIETNQILSQTNIHGVRKVGPLHMAGVRKTSRFPTLGDDMGAAFCETEQKLSEQGVQIDGERISVYHRLDFKAQAFEYTSGILLPNGAGTHPAGLACWSLPETSALCVEHVGSYEHLGNGWSAANQYARYKKLKQSKVGAYEIYKNDPNNTPAAELRTEIFLPLK